MGSYSIKDLERLSGVKAHTIRIWEQRYGVLNPTRTDTNIRRYDDAELKLLLNISQLLRHGGKISKLSRLTDDEMCRKLESIAQTVQSPEDFYSIHIDKLIFAMIELSESKFEKVISVTSIKYGFEATMLNVIIPFLTKVGLMWLTGEINVAQEHFISNLIRRKIIVAIDGLMIPEGPHRYILYLPEGEMHEMGLLFAKYILKSRGIQTLYLGQSVPLHDLIEAARLYKPDGLLAFITTPNSSKSIKQYVEALHTEFPKQDILIAGSQVNIHGLFSENGKNNVTYLTEVSGLTRFIEKYK